MHLRRFILILFIIVFTGGCTLIRGYELSPTEPVSDKKITLAVLPFHSAPDVRDSGRIVADMLANQLYALDRYNIVAPEIIDERLADREGEALSPAKTGELVGAPYIVVGSVAEYTYKAGVGETPVVGVTVRLIQASNGKVLWSATRTGTGAGNWLQEESLSGVTAMICKNLADSLNGFLQDFLLTGGLRHSNAEISQNIGTR